MGTIASRLQPALESAGELLGALVAPLLLMSIIFGPEIENVCAALDARSRSQ